MRYLKLASAKNPYNDFIELNDLNGFLCMSFQTVGISRRLEFLAIKNRQFAVDNKPEFKKYNLTIEILSKYSEYEAKHRQLITFLDRNKKDGLRLYYRPYDGMELRYCLCDIESSNRPEKMQPVLLTLSQGSLWFGEEKKSTSSKIEENGNLFVFSEDENNYYSTSFSLDENISNYYCVSFFGGSGTKAKITNSSYNEIPLNIRIYGPCKDAIVRLYKEGNDEPIKTLQVFTEVNEGYCLFINSHILENGVWYENVSTGEKTDYIELVNNEYGSPYMYINNGEYYINVVDIEGNEVSADVFYQEEYSE